jgi:hypothetical protein
MLRKAIMKHDEGIEETYRTIAHDDLLRACKLALPWLGREPQGTQEINAYVKARIALVKAIDQAEKEEL